MAMGNYPYASTYLTHGAVLLPAFPVRAACEPLTPTFRDGDQLLAALAASIAVYYNASKDLQCNELPSNVEQDGIWDWQYCTETLPQETYFSRDGVDDMFWADAYNRTFVDDHCDAKYGVTPRIDWIADYHGGRAGVDASSPIRRPLDRGGGRLRSLDSSLRSPPKTFATSVRRGDHPPRRLNLL